MAKKLVRKALEMLRKLATQETEGDDEEGEVSQHRGNDRDSQLENVAEQETFPRSTAQDTSLRPSPCDTTMPC